MATVCAAMMVRPGSTCRRMSAMRLRPGWNSTAARRFTRTVRQPLLLPVHQSLLFEWLEQCLDRFTRAHSEFTLSCLVLSCLAAAIAADDHNGDGDGDVRTPTGNLFVQGGWTLCAA
eukprot:SAG25_NODE_5071_length_707_cov_0.669408_1_plen_116_part_10